MLTQIFMIKFFKKLMTTLQSLLQKISIKNILVLILFISFTTFISCEEEISSLGENLIPESDIIQIDTITNITFTNYVRKVDSIYTKSKGQYNIGENFNSFFGEFDGRFASQFFPLNFSYPFENTVSIDSLVLYLQVDSAFGIQNNTE